MPSSNFEVGQKSTVPENRSTEAYSHFTKQEDSPNLVKAKEWSWKTGEQSKKNLVKAKIN